jgi:hypothetical protein
MPSSILRGRLVRSAGPVLAGLLLATPFHDAGAQQAARLRLAVSVAPAMRPIPVPVRASLRPASATADTIEHRRNPIVHGAQIGALVGVGAGLIYTLALNTTKSCTEKNNIVCREDEHDYRTFTIPIYTGVLGAVVGAMVGARNR